MVCFPEFLFPVPNLEVSMTTSVTKSELGHDLTEVMAGLDHLDPVRGAQVQALANRLVAVGEASYGRTISLGEAMLAATQVLIHQPVDSNALKNLELSPKDQALLVWSRIETMIKHDERRPEEVAECVEKRKKMSWWGGHAAVILGGFGLFATSVLFLNSHMCASTAGIILMVTSLVDYFFPPSSRQLERHCVQIKKMLSGLDRPVLDEVSKSLSTLPTPRVYKTAIQEACSARPPS